MQITADNLGDRAQDRITGFTGVITGYVTYITGCNQVLLAPPAVDNAFKDSQWFDSDRCEVVEPEAVKLSEVSAPERPGPDVPAPRR